MCPNFVATIDAVAPSAQRLAQHPLAQPELLAVDVGGVEERDAGVERGVDDRRRALLRLAPRARPAEVVAPHPDGRDVQGRGAEGARFHALQDVTPPSQRAATVRPPRDVRFPRVGVGGAVYSRNMQTVIDTPLFLRRMSSPIGRIEIVGNGEAIVSLSIERDGSLPDDALPERSDPILDRAVAQLEEYFAGHRHDFDLPISLAGTAFQLAVWEQLVGARLGRGRLLRRPRSGDRPGDAGPRGRRRGRREPDPDHRAVPSRARQRRPHHRLQRRRGHPDQVVAARARGHRAQRPGVGTAGADALFSLDCRRCILGGLSRASIVVGDDGRARCAWVGADAEYVRYHDEEWGTAPARRPPAVREAQPRGVPGRAVVDHDPPAAADVPRGVRGVRHRRGRGVRRARRREADERSGHHPQPREGRGDDLERARHAAARRRAARSARRAALGLRAAAARPRRRPRSTRSPPRPTSRRPRAGRSRSSATASSGRPRSTPSCSPPAWSTTTSPGCWRAAGLRLSARVARCRTRRAAAGSPAAASRSGRYCSDGLAEQDAPQPRQEDARARPTPVSLPNAMSLRYMPMTRNTVVTIAGARHELEQRQRARLRADLEPLPVVVHRHPGQPRRHADLAEEQHQRDRGQQVADQQHDADEHQVGDQDDDHARRGVVAEIVRVGAGHALRLRDRVRPAHPARGGCRTAAAHASRASTSGVVDAGLDQPPRELALALLVEVVEGAAATRRRPRSTTRTKTASGRSGSGPRLAYASERRSSSSPSVDASSAASGARQRRPSEQARQPRVVREPVCGDRIQGRRSARTPPTRSRRAAPRTRAARSSASRHPAPRRARRRTGRSPASSARSG